VLDVTQSMNVTDERVDGQPVSRLAFAKKALRQSLLHLPCGSKVGWAIFTEYRALLLLAPIEVCANLSELRSTLAQIDARMAWSGGSEIAKGLHSAIGIARQMPGKPSLVFVTDGRSAAAAPATACLRRQAGRSPRADRRRRRPAVLAHPQDRSGRPTARLRRADEVMQTDCAARGAAPACGEALADRLRPGRVRLGATPGSGTCRPCGRLPALARKEQGLEFVRRSRRKGSQPH
jgi:mxaL protein